LFSTLVRLGGGYWATFIFQERITGPPEKENPPPNQLTLLLLWILITLREVGCHVLLLPGWREGRKRRQRER
jgi:hypothetical protein